MASEGPNIKILTVGSAKGSISELFKKVQAIDSKHGKFEIVLCVGDFFGPLDGEKQKETEKLLEGEIKAPLPCYIMQGNEPLPQIVIDRFAKVGSELCPNVHLLSKSGILTTHHGLRIACLGGIYDEEVYRTTETALGFADPYFSSQTIDKLSSNIVSAPSSSQKLGSLAAIKHVTSGAAQYIDILISNEWPLSITKFSSAALPSSSSFGVPPVDDVVRRAKPRYHFAAGSGEPSQFWEREPFVWDDEVGRVTRFVSLGSFGGDHGTAKKPRWFYAFSMTPSSANQAAQPRPTIATLNPFTSTAPASKRPFDENDNGGNFIFGDVRPPPKRSRGNKTEDGKPPPGYKCKRCESTDHFISDCPERSKPPEGYVCKICNVPGHLVRDCPTRNEVGDTGGRKPPPGYVCRACGSELHLIKDCPVAASSQNQRESRGRNKGPPREIGPDECWFCLSNPSLAKHLIVSIGEECYLTLPKGQILPTGPEASTSISPIPGGGHVLIVPITHYPTLSTIPPDMALPIVDEVEKYKSSLRALYAKHGAVAVSFEVGILSGKGGHAHVQVVPIPARYKDQVEEAFVREGQRYGLQHLNRGGRRHGQGQGQGQGQEAATTTATATGAETGTENGGANTNDQTEDTSNGAITFEPDPERALASCSGGRGNYFRVDLPDGRKMVHLIKQSVPFGIQFGRHALCTLLSLHDRLDWKACAQSESEERADVDRFKAAFAPFDTVQSG